MLIYHLKNSEVKEQAIIVMAAQDTRRKHLGKRTIKIITKIRVVTKINLGRMMTTFVGLNRIWNREMKKYIVKNKRLKTKQQEENVMAPYYTVGETTTHHKGTMNFESPCLTLLGDSIELKRKIALRQTAKERMRQSLPLTLLIQSTSQRISIHEIENRVFISHR